MAPPTFHTFRVRNQQICTIAVMVCKLNMLQDFVKAKHTIAKIKIQIANILTEHF